MSVQLICPNLRCRKILKVPEEARQKVVRCQYCQSLLRVPPSSRKPAVADSAPANAAARTSTPSPAATGSTGRSVA